VSFKNAIVFVTRQRGRGQIAPLALRKARGCWPLVVGSWWHVETHVFDVSRFVEKPETLREALHLVT